ncbi:hypothetical protein BGZ76_009780, partial [Entomortierella beljakovae]
QDTGSDSYSSSIQGMQVISAGGQSAFGTPGLNDHLLGQTQNVQNNSFVNPFWPEYRLPSQQSALPLNYYTSPSQHHQQEAGANNTISTPSVAPVTVGSSKAPPASKPLNQNQAHAQTHPWRIKRVKFTQDMTSAITSNTTKSSENANVVVSVTGQQQQQSSQSSTVDATKDIQQLSSSSTKSVASVSSTPSVPQRTKEHQPSIARNNSVNQPIPSIGSSTPGLKNDKQLSSKSSGQFGPRPVKAPTLEKDLHMPDLYHNLLNAVTVRNVSKFSQPVIQSNNSTEPGGSSTAVDQFNLTLASPAISSFTVLSTEHTDPDQHHSSFQKDPSTSSFLDQTIPAGFVITNKSVIQYLVHVYFECFHTHWMIIDKEKFLAQLKSSSAPPDALLLVAICAAGAKYSDHEALCAEPGNLPTIGEQFLTHARILLQDRFDMPSMSTLQALLILYWCQVQTGRARLRFMYVGMAIRMAQEMGLNRPVNSKKLKEMSEREVQIRKTIWWSCYQADRWTSAALGKPMVISDIDCLVDYPDSLTDSERYCIDSFRRTTDLAKILGKVILNLYTSTNASTCSSAVFSQIDQSLTAWIEAIPIVSEAENALPTPTPMNSTSNRPSRTGRNLGQQRGRSSVGGVRSTTSVMRSRELNIDSGSLGASNSLAPNLPLTLQSPLILCRESAAAISEIAENMGAGQRSHRQLFNSIHISLCAAATVHRFAIVSPTVSNLDKGSRSVGDQIGIDNSPMTLPGTSNTTSSSLPSSLQPTLSKAPSHTKTDLYYLGTLLRILQSCCRFSIEKGQLKSVLENFIPSEYLSPQELAWAKYEIDKPFTIVPFSVKSPIQQATSASRPVVALNLPSTQTQNQASQHEAITLPPIQQQQQSKLQVRAKRHSYPFSNTDTNHSSLEGSNTSIPGNSTQKHNDRASSISSPGYDATIAPNTYETPTESEQKQLEQYQHELDILQQQHRLQQSELDQHHHQQVLQLEQTQFYQQQQQQQNHDYMRQNLQSPDSSVFVSQERISSRSTGGGATLSPKTLYSSTSDHTITRSKRQNEVGSKQKQYNNSMQGHNSLISQQRQQEHQGSSSQYQRQQGHQKHRKKQSRQRQEHKDYRNGVIYMVDANPPDISPRITIESLSRVTEDSEIMPNNTVPSVMNHPHGTTNLSSTGGINNFDEILGIESTGYYQGVSVANTGGGGEDMNIISLAKSTSGGHHQAHHTSFNNSERMWYAPHQLSSHTSSSNSSDSSKLGQNHNSQSQRSSVSDNISIGRPQYSLADNNIGNKQERLESVPVMEVPGPMHVAPPWFRFDDTNSPNQLPPQHPPQQSEPVVVYPYHYALYAPQQPVPHLPQIQGASFEGYGPPYPYVYAPDSNVPIGMYVPEPVSQKTTGLNSTEIPWQPQQQPQVAPSQSSGLPSISSQQMQQQQQQPLQQQPQRQQTKPKLLYFEQVPPQQMSKQQGMQQQGQHHSKKLLPPSLSSDQSIYREYRGSGRSYSTLVNSSNTANSGNGSGSSQTEGSAREESCFRETSMGEESTSRGTSVQLESREQSTPSPTRMSRSMEPSISGSNESSSNTESIENISNSAESGGSSSDNNSSSRASSTSISLASSGNNNLTVDGGNSNIFSRNTGTSRGYSGNSSNEKGGGSTSTRSKGLRRSKKAVSPLRFADSMESSHIPTGSKSHTNGPGRRYKASMRTI